MASKVWVRLMTMSPLHPCGKPCSKGTHNETVKNLALFSSIINGIMKNHGFESPSLGSVFNSSIEPKILSHLHLNIIHKSRNLIGTGGIAKFGPK